MEALRFRIHYTREDAQALLPQLRLWLRDLEESRIRRLALDHRLNHLLTQGQDSGGLPVNESVKNQIWERTLLREFRIRDIQLKDLDRGLIDFPAILGGREVFLCWEKDEETIEHWHELDSGFAGRERIG